MGYQEIINIIREVEVRHAVYTINLVLSIGALYCGFRAYQVLKIDPESKIETRNSKSQLEEL